MDKLSDNIVLFRMAERIGLTLIILIVALVVMIGFWRTIQKIDLASGKTPLGISGSFALTTPVFVLLTLVGYTWVSLAHPISTAIGPGSAGDVAVAQASGSETFTGMTTGQQQSGDDLAKARSLVENQIKSLNCLLDGDLSPRLVDDMAEVKLTSMASVWSDEWGDMGAFARWARGQSENAASLPRVVFEARHIAC